MEGDGTSSQTSNYLVLVTLVAEEVAPVMVSTVSAVSTAPAMLVVVMLVW